jgi:hypothetical protein
MTRTPRKAAHSALKAHRAGAATLLEITANLAECERAAARMAHYDAVPAQAGAEIAVINTETAKHRSLAAYKANHTRTIAALKRLPIKLTGIDRKGANLMTVH